MKNIVELREQMINVFEDLKADKIQEKKAHELSNAAGKIIGTVVTQLKYADQRKEIPNIDFLNDTESKQ